jgi:diguanylate cyclase (GGDEF)-like protein
VTGPANHSTFHEQLRTEVECTWRHGRALSVAVFDLDQQINDTRGHQTGDHVLAVLPP